jgi:hypothetical protein
MLPVVCPLELDELEDELEEDELFDWPEVTLMSELPELW